MTTATTTPSLFEPCKSLAEALTEIGQEEGNVPMPVPTAKRLWKKEESTISWKHELFGSLTITVGHKLEEATGNGVFTFARLFPFTLGHRPESINITIKAETAPGVHLMHFKDSTATEVEGGNVPTFTVPLTWESGGQGEGWMVKTCKQGAKYQDVNDDEITLIFLTPDGLFMQLELSLTSRDGEFLFFTIQELAMCQIVSTIPKVAERLGLHENAFAASHGKCIIVVPARSEDAFESTERFDWFDKFPKLTAGLMQCSASYGCVSQQSKCVIAKWKLPVPPELPEAKRRAGWQLVAVCWYNISFGGGVACHKNGDPVFVYFKSIIGRDGYPLFEKGEFPALQPMTFIAVKTAPPREEGQTPRAIKAIAL